MFLTFAGQSLEFTNGSYEETYLHLHVTEIAENTWDAEVHIHIGQYVLSCVSPSSQSTAQGALDSAAAYWMAEMDSQMADIIDSVNDARERINAHVND